MGCSGCAICDRLVSRRRTQVVLAGVTDNRPGGTAMTSSKSTRAKPAAARPKPAAGARESADHPSRLLERFLFMSDAVFAIVMTLLALELRIPEGFTDATVFDGVTAAAPRLIAFAITFAVVSVFWMGHAAITRDLERFDWPVAWANLVFLFTLTLTPFATALLGEFNALGKAWQIYCVVLIAMGVAQVVMVTLICRGRGKLVGGLTRRQQAHRLARAGSPALGFAVALGISLMGYPIVSLYAWVTIPVFMLAARLLFGPRAGESA